MEDDPIRYRKLEDGRMLDLLPMESGNDPLVLSDKGWVEAKGLSGADLVEARALSKEELASIKERGMTYCGKALEILKATDSGNNLMGWQLRIIDGLMNGCLSPVGREYFNRLWELIHAGEPFMFPMESFPLKGDK